MHGKWWLLPLIVVVVGCGGSSKIQILQENQGRFVTSNYSLLYEHWMQPKIRQLYKQEKLERFVTEYKDEWERQKALCNWTNAQWPPGDPNPYPLCNGIDILADIRSGKTKGFCGQYAYLFADALKSVGYFDVRYVELESKDHNFHFSTEVWNDRWQKWVVLDSFFNAYYTDAKGIPRSAFELHQLSTAGKEREAKINVIEKRKYQPDPQSSVGYYYSIAIGLRNDLAGLSAPLTVRDRLLMFLQYRDPAITDWQPTLRYANVSFRKEDFEYTRNQVAIRYQVDESDSLIHCDFETRASIPHFRTFVVSVDHGPWMQSSSQFDWKLTPGEHILTVAGASLLNILSHPASLKVRLLQ